MPEREISTVHKSQAFTQEDTLSQTHVYGRPLINQAIVGDLRKFDPLFSLNDKAEIWTCLFVCYSLKTICVMCFQS